MLRTIAMVVRIAVKANTIVRAVPYDRSNAAAPYKDERRPRNASRDGRPRCQGLGDPATDHGARELRPRRLSGRSIPARAGQVQSRSERRAHVPAEDLLGRSTRDPHAAYRSKLCRCDLRVLPRDEGLLLRRPED